MHIYTCIYILHIFSGYLGRKFAHLWKLPHITANQAFRGKEKGDCTNQFQALVEKLHDFLPTYRQADTESQFHLIYSVLK